MIPNNLCYLSDLNPCTKILTIQPNIKHHKLMIWRVINTQLDPSLTLYFSRPVPAEELPVYLNSDHLGIFLRDIFFYFVEGIVERVDKFWRVHEIL